MSLCWVVVQRRAHVIPLLARIITQLVLSRNREVTLGGGVTGDAEAGAGGPPHSPGHSHTVGSQGGAVSHERGTPVQETQRLGQAGECCVPSRILQLDLAYRPMVVQWRGALSYERGTPVSQSL